jgi:hypothetical protein
MSKVRAKLPKRFQFTFTLVGFTILAIILSGFYLIFSGVWKLLWPIRKLISKLKRKPKPGILKDVHKSLNTGENLS